jgi:hypothetical protein
MLGGEATAIAKKSACVGVHSAGDDVFDMRGL